MAILNATPDSFFEGSRVNVQMAVDKAGQMLLEGAHMLDIGGQSTRPGSVPVAAVEEADRVLPVIQAVCKAFPQAVVSIDTWYASVAEQALQLGAKAVNDISAGDDDLDMLPLIAKQGVQYIAMHKQGQPASMQNNPLYNNVVQEILDYFRAKKSGLMSWVFTTGYSIQGLVSVKPAHTIFPCFATCAPCAKSGCPYSPVYLAKAWYGAHSTLKLKMH